ncbi:hypothetical protein Cha6605_0922 [Chamaesiphon minutus PCC 6605]|uniref:Uncharacterized protein n=1 Tax=Chamaesiphon minutus (strain ATCC 27169 / PCC 6605) TaxID=1173020 RepID=K9UD85_CHAP6|nr:DUF6653 family protein [Chamaesiphon minutus]AFY92179.1 hypothetical protein Cha6605_0922 [Chamaesiphon minutus PCC 6605]
MTFERKIAAAFKMSDEAWLRHANPWSGWTRFTTVLPLLILAIWSRVWLDWWSLLPITGAVLWMWFNPHVFPKPSSTKNWISKGVLGERVWLNRDRVPVPQHHQRIPNFLNGIAAIGGVFVVWGLAILSVWGVAFSYTPNTENRNNHNQRNKVKWSQIVRFEPLYKISVHQLRCQFQLMPQVVRSESIFPLLEKISIGR